MTNKKPKKREVVITDDGSHSLYVPGLNEHYHSTHGAVQESTHVFIKTGLLALSRLKAVSVLEIGFGTGLNALLTLAAAEKTGQDISYTAIEKYPITDDELCQLNYASKIGGGFGKIFEKMHLVPWGSKQAIGSGFTLRKIMCDFVGYKPTGNFDLVFFDAFAPDIQPKLWGVTVFAGLYGCMNPNGILVTYSAKGQVRRNLQAAGFVVERLPGPPGKREMLRGIKTFI